MVAALREVLGDDLRGAYLHGSAVLGGLRPHSDVDVLAVSTRPTTLAEKHVLAARLGSLSGRRAPVPARPVELTVVVAADVRPWRAPGRLDFQYGEWLRDDFENGDLEPWADDAHVDVAVLVEIARRGDTSLFGPPAGDLLDTVPAADLDAAMLAAVAGCPADDDGSALIILLTLDRIWCSLATGEIRSKADAASWALERLPEAHRAPLVRARAVYSGAAEERWDDLAAEVTAHVDHVVAEIERRART